jgi:fluoroacetyl-CoA thioesterase
MDWRTTDERFNTDAEILDGHEAGFGPLAGTAHPTLEPSGHRRVRLGAALFDDLQMARATRGRFGGDFAAQRGDRMNNHFSAEASLVVAAKDTARHIALAPCDAFPEVFATSRMIALMELAAARAMKPLLGEGQLSVGVSLNVRHTAATPVGSNVRAMATYLRTEAKLMHFQVEAFDDAGSIGSGEHARAIVDTGRLLSGAERRRGPSLPKSNRA